MTSTAPTPAFDWLNRPVFKSYQRLTPERLNRVLAHQSARLRQALLGLAGPGVVHGFGLPAPGEARGAHDKGCLYVECGLAIDCHGRQLFWPGGWLRWSDLAGDLPGTPGRYTLLLHYAENVASSADGCASIEEGDWAREGVVFRLQPECHPHTPGCPSHCGECVGTTDYVCGRLGGQHGPIPAAQDLAQLCVEPGPLHSRGPDGWMYDPKGGLALACVEVCDLHAGQANCAPKLGFCRESRQACDHRQFVYRNPLLFELISGCHVDLPRVEKLSFHGWAERGVEDPVPWHEFADGARRGLRIWFSKPIENRTLNPASVFVTAVLREQDSYFRDVLRLPMDHIEHLDSDGTRCKGVCLSFTRRWIENQLESQLSRFSHGALLEVTVRGAELRDGCGNMLDARPLDVPRHKPGQSMPGNDFVVAFSVAPRRRHDRDEPEDAGQYAEEEAPQRGRRQP